MAQAYLSTNPDLGRGASGAFSVIDRAGVSLVFPTASDKHSVSPGWFFSEKNGIFPHDVGAALRMVIEMNNAGARVQALLVGDISEQKANKRSQLEKLAPFDPYIWWQQCRLLRF